MVPILGWFKAGAARASRRKRSSACASRARFIRKKLQRYKAAEIGTFGLVDHTHPSATKPFDDPIV
jgi:hypothetical protein